MNAEKVLIHDIDELKTKLWKVIIISLIVHIFKQALIVHVDKTIDLILMSAVVLLLAISLYLIEKMWSCVVCEKRNEKKSLELEKSL